jgi:hypothetical protein
MQDVNMVGAVSDRQARQELRRADDARRREVVSMAREAIYKRNFAVDSAYVERQLKDESLVPSFVSLVVCVVATQRKLRPDIHIFRMPFPIACPDLDSISSPYFLLT